MVIPSGLKTYQVQHENVLNPNIHPNSSVITLSVEVKLDENDLIRHEQSQHRHQNRGSNIKKPGGLELDFLLNQLHRKLFDDFALVEVVDRMQQSAQKLALLANDLISSLVWNFSLLSLPH